MIFTNVTVTSDHMSQVHSTANYICFSCLPHNNYENVFYDVHLFCNGLDEEQGYFSCCNEKFYSNQSFEEHLTLVKEEETINRFFDSEHLCDHEVSSIGYLQCICMNEIY